MSKSWLDCTLFLPHEYSRLNNGINEKEEEQKRAVSGKVCFWVQGRISPNLSKPALHQQMDGVNCIFPFFLWRIIIIILWFCLFLGRWCCTHLLLYFKNWNHISGCSVQSSHHMNIYSFMHWFKEKLLLFPIPQLSNILFACILDFCLSPKSLPKIL